MTDGIIGALDRQFPDDPKYKHDIPEGFERPCFYVQSRDPMHTEGLGYRAMRTYPFIVHFFPARDDDRARETCRKVGDVLFDILEYIELSNGMIKRGYKKEFNVTEDGILQVQVRYDMHYRRHTEYDKMQVLTVDEEVKEWQKKQKR